MTTAALKSSLRAYAHYWIPGLVILGFLGAWHYKPASLQRLRREYFDALNRARPRRHFEVPVVIVGIDDESLKKVGQWPWPRTVVARLVDRLQELGATAVALDIVFAEPDRTSPRQLAENIPDQGDWKRLRGRYLSLPDHDEVLAKSLAGARAVTSFALSDQGGRLPAQKAAIAWAKGAPDASASLPDFPGTVPNLPSFEKAATGNACSTIFQDSDGVIRRIPLLFRIGGALYPTLSIETMRVNRGLTAISPVGAVSGVRLGQQFIPTDADGSLRLYFEAAAETYKTPQIPAWQFLDPSFDDGSFHGKIALVGLTAAGLRDVISTPIGDPLTAVDVHAQAIAQMMEEKFLTRPAWAESAEIGCLIILCLALLFLMPVVGPAWGGLGALLAIVALSWLSFMAYARRGWLLDPVIPALALAGVHITSALALHLRARAERHRMELLDRLKDELISTVSHDLRSPVAAIIMYLDAILNGSYGPLTDKQRKMLVILRDSSRRLTFFVSNILDAAKVKAGRLKFSMSELRVDDLFAEADALYLSASQLKKVELEHRAPPDLPPFEGDREKLGQVINNLVGNAFKFTPKGGRITLEAERDGERLLLRVSDTGFGIEPEKMPHLFAKLQELDLDKPREERGVTGLGLSICKAIVDGHGGEIRAESEVGRGTTVTVILPLKQHGLR